MNQEWVAHLERTLRAFVRLVDKLEEVGQSEEFARVFVFCAVHELPYRGPSWDRELKEAKEALAEAKRIANEPL
jgi:hypothetical protein